ncbi:hypothetical protein AB0L82_22130 [Nocardia sp. NPDC052001]|uniref:hypothetical protein n=1 Tax=Nocardia sp. NPDC052001 TaxID=3154853 RepID=UPI003438720C
MTTSEQRVRARKTRKADDMPERAPKPNRGRRERMTSPEAILRTWTCEGQLDLFDPPDGSRP